MKKSKRYLSILMALPFVIALILLISVRIMIGNVDDIQAFYSKDHIELDGGTVLKNYDFTDFQRVKIVGYWKVEVKQGDAYSVMVGGPGDKLKAMNINQSGDQVNFLQKFPASVSGDRMEVLIFMPDLEQLSARGDCRIYIDEFDCDDLILDFDGTGRLVASGNKIDNLDMTARGQLDLDLEDSEIASADLDLTGNINTDLTMSGGELTGRATGNVKIDYFGNVAREIVKTHGASTIEHVE